MLNSTNRLLFLSILLLFLISGFPTVHGRSFKRPDPLQHFKNYNGDFDVRNKHYLAVSRFSIINNVYVCMNMIITSHVGAYIYRFEKLRLVSDPFQSAAFTGVHGYAFAGVWLLCGVVLGIFMMLKCLCSGSPSLPCLDHYLLHIFFLLLFLTSLAM